MTEHAGPAEYLEAGRALQRVWLDATSLGLALHSWTSLLYLAARRAADGGGFSVEEAEMIGRLDAQLRAIAPLPAGHAPRAALSAAA